MEDGFPQETVEANALLIAAAPGMYQALFDLVYASEWGPRGAAKRKLALEFAKALIDKVESGA